MQASFSVKDTIEPLIRAAPRILSVMLTMQAALAAQGIGSQRNDTFLFDVDNALGLDFVHGNAGIDTLNFADTTADIAVDIGDIGGQVVRLGFLILGIPNEDLEAVVNGDEVRARLPGFRRKSLVRPGAISRP